MYLVYPADPEEVHARRATFQPFIERSLAHSVLVESADDLLWRCVNQDNCWLIQVVREDEVVAVATVEIVDTKMGKCLHTITLAGDGMAEWLSDYIELLHELGWCWRCDHITMTGRRG